MSIHKAAFEGAGQTYRIDIGGVKGREIRVEDWWDRVTGSSWQQADGNPAALFYAVRSACTTPPLPIDDEVLYGKVRDLGHLVHVSELGERA